jgi:hypothetical protein
MSSRNLASVAKAAYLFLRMNAAAVAGLAAVVRGRTLWR